ncbi:hypothetical protein C7C46_05530 [Streptomyces tateyamensis]|uniref:Uncharacterized protein n=1 Tax=Streptomyces tateyamensis TaxID=565073 RepID=A0A2V4NMA7_9ACTN|nr:hypothetical protein [Streptomyces tateyamensis]PYC86573.1 hypothetical protein C7C46_05530 [Streptomyces tateyamensis]
MTHNDVAQVRTLPARSVEPRSLNRRLGCEDGGPFAELTARTLVRDLESRTLVRRTEGGR